MKLFIATLSLTSLLLFSYGQMPEVRFELSSSSERIFLGEKAFLTLRIYDPGLMHLVINNKMKVNGEFQDIINPSAFSYTIQYEPVDTGIIKLGPYKIEYQNQELVSNEIYVKVLEQLNDKYLIFDVPSSIQCNSSGNIKIRSNKTDVGNIELKSSTYFTINGRTTSTSTNTINNESETVYIKIFEVKFIRSGILELTKEDLINVPNNYDIDPVKIVIN